MKRLFKNVKVSQDARKVLNPMDIIVALIRHFRSPSPEVSHSKDDGAVISSHFALKSPHQILIESNLLTRQTFVSILNPA